MYRLNVIYFCTSMIVFLFLSCCFDYKVRMYRKRKQTSTSEDGYCQAVPDAICHLNQHEAIVTSVAPAILRRRDRLELDARIVGCSILSNQRRSASAER